MDISKLLLNPTRLRIIQYIIKNIKVTTSNIVASLNDIPRATIYHHVKLLEENGLIKVVEENRIRGTVEKVYKYTNEKLEDVDDKLGLATGFYMGLLQETTQYLNEPDCDCERDQVFFTTAVLSVTDEEYKKLIDEMSVMFEKYVDYRKTAGKKLRKLTVVSLPPEK